MKYFLLLLSVIAAVAAGVLFLRPAEGSAWHATDLSGVMPPLQFSMTRTRDGREVTAADYRGKIVLLYFGYTFCPDICPATLSNAAVMLKQLGPDADRVRLLFVTVDPNRDTLPVLADYVKNFGPEIDGLRGTPDQIAMLARRYRVAYSVRPAAKNRPYEVSHSVVLFVFDGSGAVRLLFSSLSSPSADIGGDVADLKRLIAEAPK